MSEDSTEPTPLSLAFLSPNPLSTTLVSPDGVPVYRVITDNRPFRSKVTTIVRYDGLGPRYPHLFNETTESTNDLGSGSSTTHVQDTTDGLSQRRRDGGTEIARAVWEVWPHRSRSRALTVNGREVNAEAFWEKRGFREKTEYLHTSQGTYEWAKKSEIKDSLGTLVAKIRSGKLCFRPLRFIPTTFEFDPKLDEGLIDEIIVAYVLRNLSLGCLIGVGLGSESMKAFLLHLDLALIVTG